MRSTSSPKKVTPAETPDDVYGALFDAASDGILIADAHGRIIWVNPRACQLLGYAAPQIVGRPLVELARVEDSQDIARHLEGLLAGENASLACELYRQDGGTLAVVIAGHLLVDGGLMVIAPGAAALSSDQSQSNTGSDNSPETDLSEAIYRDIFEQAADGIFIANPDGRYVLVNRSACELLGYTRAELLRLGIADVTAQDEQGSLAERLDNLKLHGALVNERRLRRKDGSLVQIQLNSRVLPDGRLLGIVHDLTARKEMEAALEESEERFRSVYENSRIGFYRTTPAGRILMVNPAAVRMLGYASAAELSERNLEQDGFEPTYDRSDFREKLEREGKITGLESAWVKKDGSSIFVRESAIVMRSKQGDVLYYDGTFEDITDRKLAEESLRQANESLQALIDYSPLAITLSDLDNRLRLWNHAAERMYGWTSEEALGNFIPTVTAEKRREYDALHERIMRGESITNQEVVRVRKDGSEIMVGLSIAPLRDSHGSINGVMSIALDISGQKQAEAGLRERTEELEALFSISAHLRQAASAADMLPVVMEEVRRLLSVDTSSVILLEPDGLHVSQAVADGSLKANAGRKFSAQEGITAHVFQTRQAYVTLDFKNDPKLSRQVQGIEHLGPAVFAPLQSETDFLGMLIVARERTPSRLPFSPTEVRLITAIGEMVGNALRRARLFDQAVSRLQYLQALRTLDSAITSSLDPRVTLRVLLSEVTSKLKADAACVFLLNPHTLTLEFAAGSGFRTGAVEQMRYRMGESRAGQVALERRVLSLPDLMATQNLARAQWLQDEGFVAYHAAPMITKGQVRGVLETYNRQAFAANDEWQEFLESLAVQAAIAIDNGQLFTDLQRSNLELALAYDATIEGWSRALDLRDRETEGHTQRVSEMTLQLAQAFGIEEIDLVHIRRGALLHDIGKMGVPDRILLKPDQLSEEEWVLMRQHPQYAYDMLVPIEFLRPALEIPYYHHEKWDGSGYPHGMQGEAIPLAARIFTVVDVWDALISDRPYRKAWPKEKALSYIREQAGRHFDPRVVETFLRVINTKEP